MYRESKDLPATQIQYPRLNKWLDRTDWAEKFGGFHVDHRQDALRWERCAVGFEPTDETLQELGSYFALAVFKNQYGRCRELIAAIDRRFVELGM